ncbi:hypothetical protein [Cohnella hongkongensis]|uniref:Mannosyl-glycoprotein endo-beta-N-acetylglucosamidase-like domain-containing protein n=1 Tax=Cohnella hongkongensis TaxID=178337 RepID=A0ABV9F7F0_9BACL
MESAALLSPTDIHTIRRYVQTKYAPLPDGRRAEIVADAIRRALAQRLPNVPEEIKLRMIDQLISRCLVGERRDILPDDVLDLFAEIGTDDELLTERLLEPILEWANERTQRRWSPEQLASRLERRRRPAPEPSAESVAAPEVRARDRSGWREGIGKAVRGWVRPGRALALASVLLVGAAGTIAALSGDRPAPVAEPVETASPAPAAAPEPTPDIGMPQTLQYTEIDEAALVDYLNSRDSLLSEEPYFGTIMATAREYDLHPHLLFAITGQEQGFVPRSAKHALKIANNPFNVGHSWMEYNTDIENSAGIAARLLVKLGKSRPEGHDPFEWFNRTYAEDPLWSVGVRKLFDKLNSLSADEPTSR